MAHTWFETIAEAQRRARRRLPPSVYSALLAGSEKGITYHDNVEAFSELGFAPRTAGQSHKRDLSVPVMGQTISMPALISPTGVQAVHPDGEVAVARAAAARGTAMGLSSFASKSVEEVCAVNDQVFFQVYWLGSREQMVARMQRARAAGVKGIILTLDWSFSYGRDWGSPKIPERVDLKAMAQFAPEAIRRPQWFASFARSGAIPDLTCPNIPTDGEPPPTFFGAYYQWMQTPPPTWEDVAWLRSQWEGPFMVKGVTRVDEARRAVDAGVSAISVSNHGGNNVDGTPATIRLLPSVVEAVGGQLEIVLDGGVRRGSDVVKAVALGARAVMLGRAYLWGLAVGGQAGVENVLDVIRNGIDSTMTGLGYSAMEELSPTDVVVPPGFTRTLGVPAGR